MRTTKMSNTSNDPWCPKSAKLRAACNQCHAAKVRCSGEKDGCQRCRNFHHPCEYSVSMVGKASGSRRKNKRARSLDEQQRASSLERPAPERPARREADRATATKSHPVSCDPIAHWVVSEPGRASPDFPDFDWNGSACFAGQSPSLADFDMLMPSSLESDQTFVNLGFNDKMFMPASLDELLGSSLSTDITKYPPSFQQPPHHPSYSDTVMEVGTPSERQSPLTPDRSSISSSSASFKNNGSPCLSTCVRVIEQLEAKAHSSLVAMDDILFINRTSVLELIRIMDLPTFREASSNCLLLISVAINQLVAVFESSIQLEDSSSGIKLGKGGMVPQLLFGSFPVDQEEQVAFSSRIICREIMRCKEALVKLSGLLGHFSMQEVQSVGLDKHWFASTARRLESLIAAVEE